MTHEFLGRRGRLALTVTTALLAVGLTAGTASAATSTFTNAGFINIPDNSVGSPYPSTVNVTGFAGNVQKVTATLHGFSHSCPDDIAVLLVGPSGTNSILMGHVGGCPGEPDPAPIELSFDQASPNVLGDNNFLPAGSYRPAQNVVDMQPLSAPAPSGPTYPADLNVFNNQLANGTWSLFIEDQVSG